MSMTLSKKSASIDAGRRGAAGLTTCGDRLDRSDEPVGRAAPEAGAPHLRARTGGGYKLTGGRWLAALIIAALSWHAVTKWPDHLAEMIWVCHVASLVLALGLFSGRQALVAAGLLLHLSWGAPAYLLDVLATRSTTVTSLLVHALPVLAGLWAVAARGWPRGTVLPSWIFFLLWVPISHVATDPALNINLAHAPWPPLAAVLPGLWSSWAFNAAGSWLAFLAIDRLMARWRPRPAAAARARVADQTRPAASDSLPVLGALALLFFAVHCADHVRRGELDHLLWLSNLATLVLAAGCAWRRAPLVALATLWLSLSALLWTLDVIVARSPVDSAVLTHLGSLGIALLAARALGVPPRTWLVATGGLALLVGFCRLATARAHNVNLAFTISPGWEARFGGHGVYLASLLLLAAALFYGLERAWRRDGRGRQVVRP